MIGSLLFGAVCAGSAGREALFDGAAVGFQHDSASSTFCRAMPWDSSPSTNNSLPAERSKTSRAFFGMTICPRSPMRTMPKMCLPRGGTGKPAACSLWVTKSSRLTPKSSASIWAFTRSGTDSPDSHFATLCRETPRRPASSSWVSPLRWRKVAMF